MLHVVCVKQGTKFPSQYVNKLKNMVARHLSYEHHFWCFTDDAVGIDSDIVIHTLPTAYSWLQGWWWKPYLFSNEHFAEGDTILFLDLDLVILSSIDKLIDYQPGKFVGLRDVSRVFNYHRNRLGSAVMRWTAKTQNDIWNMLETDSQITKIYRGDQEFIWGHFRDRIEFYPDEWILSYKWEIRNRKELVGKKENMRFTTTIDPEIPNECCVTVFHGHPRLEVVDDPVIVNNWQ